MKQTPPIVTVSALPRTVAWAKRLAGFQIGVGVLFTVFCIWLFNFAASSETIDELRQALASGMGFDLAEVNGLGGAGYIVAVFLVALSGSISSLIAITRQSKAWAIAAIILLGAYLISAPSLLTLAILVLMVVKPSRVYFSLSK